jgi:hypothetical protein
LGCPPGHRWRRFRIAFSLDYWTLAQTLVITRRAMYPLAESRTKAAENSRSIDHSSMRARFPL